MDIYFTVYLHDKNLSEEDRHLSFAHHHAVPRIGEKLSIYFANSNNTRRFEVTDVTHHPQCGRTHLDLKPSK